MRAFHFQWLSFFVAFMAWFAYAPLLVIIRQDLDISTLTPSSIIMASLPA